MPLLSASVDTFILGAIVCLIVFTYRGSAPTSTKDARQPKYRPLVTGILVIHTLYMIYTLSFKTPPNLFTRLHLPLSMPSQKIRAVLLARMGSTDDDALPEHIEELLARLNTYDLRTYFVRSVPTLRDPLDLTRSTRFGQNTVQECEWCTTFTDFAAYTVVAIVLSYIKEAALLGAVTIRGTNHETWRSTVISVLVLACIADVCWMLTVRITVDQQEPTMVSPVYYRHLSQCLIVIF